MPTCPLPPAPSRAASKSGRAFPRTLTLGKLCPATFPDCFSPLETSREASESLLGILRAIKAWNVLNVAEIDAYGRVLSLRVRICRSIERIERSRLSTFCDCARARVMKISLTDVYEKCHTCQLRLDRSLNSVCIFCVCHGEVSEISEIASNCKFSRLFGDLSKGREQGKREIRNEERELRFRHKVILLPLEARD